MNQVNDEHVTETKGSTAWQSFKFAFKAVEIRLRFIAIIILLGIFVGNWETIHNHWDKWTRPASIAAELPSDQEFYCPMHPTVVRDKPDPNGDIPKCPICGMPLSKRKKGEAAELPAGVLSRVQVSPERVQFAGIQTAEVEYRPLVHEIRTIGYVDFDESRLSRIVARAAGYLEKLYVNKTFEQVQEGAPLAEIYSPELYTAARELLLATERKGMGDLTAVSRQRLKLLGVGDEEIDNILKTKEAQTRILIRSPQTGHVIRKEVVEGDRVETGMRLFDIADLSEVWVEAEVFERDIPFLTYGAHVEATVEALPGRVFVGTVSLVHPHLETETRTNRVRFEIENPEHLLRPGMYATVQITRPMEDIEPFHTLLTQQRERAQPRVLPADADDKQLIDAQKICPVTEQPLGSMGKPIRVMAGERPVFLCCPACKGKFEAESKRFLNKLDARHKAPTDGVLAVPERAVIDTGTRKIVYVEREPGVFEGHEVILGPRSGEYYSVIEGLLPGDRVAAAGAFLIDAETRLNPAASGAYFGAAGGPAGSQSSATSKATSAGKSPAKPSNGTFEFSAKALGNLERLSESDRRLAVEQQFCPITKKELGSMGVPVTVQLGNRTVYLCCSGCEDAAKRQPSKTLQTIDGFRHHKNTTENGSPSAEEPRP